MYTLDYIVDPETAGVTLPITNAEVLTSTWDASTPSAGAPSYSHGVVELVNGVKFRNPLIKEGFSSGEWIFGNGKTNDGRLSYMCMYAAPMDILDRMLPPTTGWVTRKELFAGNFTNEPNNSGDILYSEESMNTFSKVEAAVGNSFINHI